MCIRTAWESRPFRGEKTDDVHSYRMGVPSQPPGEGVTVDVHTLCCPVLNGSAVELLPTHPHGNSYLIPHNSYLTTLTS